ncbi:hypothetical protein, partial [Mesorhizobium sp. M7A.F.Ca.CA.001.08.1.1]|uniref:hypothetical protein n=1 Tax=Mesorhizobium sp. M7A.F.Ca.CA.001.08.1.1 TaxID=2496691 RepID=UPI0019D19619
LACHVLNSVWGLRGAVCLAGQITDASAASNAGAIRPAPWLTVHQTKTRLCGGSLAQISTIGKNVP